MELENNRVTNYGLSIFSPSMTEGMKSRILTFKQRRYSEVLCDADFKAYPIFSMTFSYILIQISLIIDETTFVKIKSLPLLGYDGKVKGKVVPEHLGMKAYWGVDVYIHSFFISTLD
jgi:preprotein translocase subunit Sec63